MVKAEVVLECANRLGEGPVWCPREQVLWWVDIVAPAIWCFDPATGEHRSFPMPEHVGSLSVRERGGLIVAMKSGFATFDPESGQITMLAPVEADRPENRFNDGRCDRAGRFLAGSLTYSEDRPAGALYRLDPDHGVHRLITGLTVPNGLCFSPDGRTMYHVDTPTREILTYDYDLARGLPASPRTFVRVPGPGWPDGAIVDAEGFLWSGEWDGARVVRYAPDGRVERIVEVPARRATSVAFGGPDLATLYITSAWDRMSEPERAEWPLSGHLFAYEAGVAGLPDPRYKG